MFKLSREAKHQVIAKERLYLTADRSRVVPHGDKDAAFLLAAQGQPIAIDVAEKFGLVEKDAVAVEAPPRSNRRATPSATR